MTLLACYQEYEGLSVDIDGVPADAGQCVQWAELVLNLVYGLPYFFAPGAIDWWENTSGSLLNFDKIPYTPSMQIKAGDFVIYGTGVGSVFGHIDVAAEDGTGTSYIGYDSNWGRDLTVHTVNHNDSYNQYILGILRIKEANVAQLQPGDIDRAIKGMLGRQPTAEELGNQDYANNAALLIETLWNNGGEARFNTPPVAPNATQLAPGLYQVV